MYSHSVPLRLAWVEIDTGAIEHNARQLVQMAGSQTEIMAMVKSNAYGHGAIESARAALRGGCTWLGVYSVGEGVELRAAGIAERVLVVGATPPSWIRAAVENELAFTIVSVEGARTANEIAQNAGSRAHVHIEVDTGMTRLGVDPDKVNELVRGVSRLPALQLEGVFTHFARADEVSEQARAFTQSQLTRFCTVRESLERENFRIPYWHAANSPAIVHLPNTRFNLARSGILLYGLDPSAETPRPSGFRPALAFKTQIAAIRSVPSETPVSYGGTFVTARASRIGVLMVGYADGFRRAPRDSGHVLVRGKRAPIVGRVCMDQTMVDVTDIPDAREGDEVVLIGRQGNAEISAEQVAESLGTNNYEVVTTISARVKRNYINYELSQK